MLRPAPAGPPSNVAPPNNGINKPPPPPRAPPPPRPASAPKPPAPPLSAPPKKPTTPPPPPPRELKRPPPPPPLALNSALPKRARHASVSIEAPIELRDVNVYLRKQKVGQGTYGSVFVGVDRQTNEVVALKRINTNQEENGFPITALREVKILKALNHKNIVRLKEIVTSKG